MKIYIDEISGKDMLGVLRMLPKILVEAVKEEWFWWTKLYKYELSAGDWNREHDEGLAESRRRIKERR